MPLSPTDFYTSHLAGLHSQLLNHPIVHDYLSGVGIKISGKTLAPDDVLELDFGTFSILELAHLFSIFDKSRVHMQVEKEESLDVAPAGIYLTIINKRVIENLHKNKLGVYQRTDSTRVDLVIQDMHIDHYFLKENQTPATLGTIAFALCAITAHLADMGRITLVAAGGRGSAPRYIGVQVWPKLGFDAPLFEGEAANAPQLDGCKTVQDVIARNEAWWLEHGTQRMMSFDLAAHSVSWQKLLTYISRKLSLGSQS